VSHFEHLGDRVSRSAAGVIRDVIARKQIKLGSLSESTGIPRSTLHNKLGDKGELTLAELVQLAIALEVPAADLVAAAIAAAESTDEGPRQ
jgi:DNA-binding Xre family transcriptional regulator